MFDLGDIVGLAVSITDAAGVAANATALTCTITRPDGTSASPTVTNAATGSYTVDYTPTLVGRHLVRWAATGTNASSYTDTFDVNDPADLTLISLADAKTYLNITSTNSDEEIRQFILEATDIAERLTGRQLRRRTFVEAYNGSDAISPYRGLMALRLRKVPVISITSVVENGLTLDSTAYTVSPESGVLYRGSSIFRQAWLPGEQNITITYAAGDLSNVTAQTLVKELTRHLWRTQRGASPMSMGGDDYVPGSANVLTYRVQELAALITIPNVG